MSNYLGRPLIDYNVRSGNTAQLEQQLKDPVMRSQINDRLYKDGDMCPLHVACLGESNRPTVELLVNNKAKGDAKDAKGRVPMHYAANSADPEIVEYFIVKKGCTKFTEVRDKDGRTALHALFMPAFSSKVKRTAEDIKLSLEILLSKYNSKHRIKFLIQDDRFGVTPLMYAKHYGHLDIFPIDNIRLEDIRDIPEDSEALERDFFDRTPLLVAAGKGLPLDVQEALDDPKVDPQVYPKATSVFWGGANSLIIAIREGASLDTIKKLLNNAATDPAARDNDGATPLHYAAEAARLDIVHELLRYQLVKNEIDATDKRVGTALHACGTNAANREYRLQIVEELVNAGIDISRKFKNKTAAELAEESGNYPVADKIVRYVIQEERIEEETQKGKCVPDLVWAMLARVCVKLKEDNVATNTPYENTEPGASLSPQ